MTPFIITICLLLTAYLSTVVPAIKGKDWNGLRIFLVVIASIILVLSIGGRFVERADQQRTREAAAKAKADELERTRISGTLGPVPRLSRRGRFTLIGGVGRVEINPGDNFFAGPLFIDVPEGTNISLEDEEGEIKVNARILSPEGRVIEIVKNDWKLWQEGYERNFNRNHFELRDRFGKVAFQLSVHSDIVYFQARMATTNNSAVTFFVKTNHNGELMGAMAGQNTVNGRNARIDPIFKYPVERYQGVMVDKPYCH